MSIIRLSLTSVLVITITFVLFHVPNIFAQLVSVIIWSVSVAFLVQQQEKQATTHHEDFHSVLQYTSLDEYEIRLLILEPSDQIDGKLIGKLVTHHLDTGPEYTALSYHSDPKSGSELITVDERQVHISGSLAAGLRCMRSHLKLSLWVDQICLDQSNNVEMSSQILRMSTNFQKAREGAVWLGPSDTVTDLILKKLNQTIHPELGLGITPAMLRCVIDRPVWSRLWVVQEVSASVSSRIYCGSNTLEWIAFARLIANIAQYFTVKSSGMQKIQTIIAFHADRLDSKKFTLLEALSRTTRYQTSEPCDKVFALLGMILDSQQYITEIDFWSEKNEHRLCRRMTERHFRQMTSLDMVFLGSKGRSAHLPSWCPDFTNLPSDAITRGLCQYVSGTDLRFRMGKQVIKWSATGNTEPGQRVFRVQSGVLKATGTFITSVDVVSANTRDDLQGLEDLQQSSKSLTSALFRRFWADPKTRSALYELSTMYSESAISDGEREFIRVYERTTTMLSFVRFWEAVDSFQKGPHITGDGSPLTNTIMSTTRALLAEGLIMMNTSQGMPGWVHPAAETGDEIWLIESCSMPVVLRRVFGDDLDSYQVVGHCYLSKSIMFGEVWKGALENGLQKSINLV